MKPHKLKCAFCKKHWTEVRHMIADRENGKAAICDECVLACVEMIFHRPAPAGEAA